MTEGQATVEFALVFLLLVAMLYGILEIGRLVFINAEIENAAREAAHYAALHPSVSAQDLKTNVVAPKLALVDTSGPDLSVSAPTFSRGMGPFYPVEVTVTYNWTSLVNIMPDMSTLTLRPLGPIPLSATAMKLIEGR